MKTLKVFWSLILISTLTLQSSSSLASHGMGGELHWECLPSGAFRFTLKFYRDCNGIPAPSGLDLNTTVPGVLTIQMPRIQINDISPQGFMSNGTTGCPSCAVTGGNPGVIEEHIYQSAPVFLNGTPPATGWEFYWGECCRSGAISNLVSPGSTGMRINAKMYPFNGQNMNPCFDSSPFFAERPHGIVCAGLPVTYQHLAFDHEFDSLQYSFSNPLTDAGTPATFASGFGVNNPLPGTNALDPFTGEYFSNTQSAGYYATAIKVSAYKCGVLVSENFREVHIIILAYCPNVAGNVSNQPPAMAAPFADPITGLFTSYHDTVMAGDTINFSIQVLDGQQFTNGNLQMVTYNAYGLQYGTAFTDPNAGCLIPPCATITPPPIINLPGAFIIQFDWITDPAHLNYSFSCVQFSNTYYFMNKSYDNYCPANAVENRTFSITVIPTIPKPPLVNNNGVLECNWGPNYIYQWFFNRWAIPGATGSSHVPQQNGTYHLLAVAPDGNGNYSDAFVVNFVGVNEVQNELQYSVYPNPSMSGLFTIEWNKADESPLLITITDFYGRIIQTSDQSLYSSTSGSQVIDLSGHSAGCYLVELESPGKYKYRTRLMK